MDVQPTADLRRDYSITYRCFHKGGSFGHVSKIKRRSDKVYFALKTCQKGYSSKYNRQIKREKFALECFNHRNVLKLLAVYEDEWDVHFLFDFIKETDMFQLFHNYYEKNRMGLPEAYIKFFAAELISALDHVRQRGFVHRKVQLANVLVTGDYHIKLCDFGNAKPITDGHGGVIPDTNSHCKEHGFISPEEKMGDAYTYSTDLWGVAVCLSVLFYVDWVCKRKNIEGEDWAAYFNRIDMGVWVTTAMASHTWPALEAFIYDLTRRNPSMRVGAQNIKQVRSHLFFDGFDWDNLHTMPVPNLFPPGTRRVDTRGTSSRKGSPKARFPHSYDACRAYRNHSIFGSPADDYHGETLEQWEQGQQLLLAAEAGSPDTNNPPQQPLPPAHLWGRPGVGDKLPVQTMQDLIRDYDFFLSKVISKGGYGHVSRIYRRSDGEVFALKTMQKGFSQGTNTNVKRELTSHENFDHPNILKCFAVYEDWRDVHFLFEWVAQTDLANLVSIYYRTNRIGFPEPCCRFYLAEIISALEHLRERGFVHRDMKPENILMTADFHTKLSDFGTCKPIKDPTQPDGVVQQNNEHCGTHYYMAPEVLFGDPVTYSTDLWGVAVCLSFMYYGEWVCHQQDGEMEFHWYKRIERRGYHTRSRHSTNPADDMLDDLIFQTTRKDPALRIGAANFQDLKDHLWFEGFDWDNLHTMPVPDLFPPPRQFVNAAPPPGHSVSPMKNRAPPRSVCKPYQTETIFNSPADPFHGQSLTEWKQAQADAAQAALMPTPPPYRASFENLMQRHLAPQAPAPVPAPAPASPGVPPARRRGVRPAMRPQLSDVAEVSGERHSSSSPSRVVAGHGGAQGGNGSLFSRPDGRPEAAVGDNTYRFDQEGWNETNEDEIANPGICAPEDD